MAFGYEFELRESFGLVHLRGNLMDQSQAGELISKISESISDGMKYFVVNMHEMEYMNSTGLTVLINILTKTRNSGGETVICCVPDRIKTLLIVTKLNNVFSVASDEPEAILIIQNMNVESINEQNNPLEQ
jgi:anti-sigma B factor antagonist